MREWSNFTRNAIDQLQIVLTNLKSKLGKFLCPKMAKLIFQPSKMKIVQGESRYKWSENSIIEIGKTASFS